MHNKVFVLLSLNHQTEVIFCLAPFCMPCLLYLQTWADAFKGSPELKEVEKIYLDLKGKGIEFPMTDLDNLAPIHTPARVR